MRLAFSRFWSLKDLSRSDRRSGGSHVISSGAVSVLSSIKNASNSINLPRYKLVDAADPATVLPMNTGSAVAEGIPRRRSRNDRFR